MNEKEKNIDFDQMIIKIAQFILLSFISLGFWFGLVYFDFGATGIGSLIEIPIVILLVAITLYLMRRKKFYEVFLVLLVVVFLLRAFMPELPWKA